MISDKKPVYISQSSNESLQVEKENRNEENLFDDEIPSSQNAEVGSSQDLNLLSQSRFISQRNVNIRRTQCGIESGKNYFQITLMNCQMQITEMGVECTKGNDTISFIRRVRVYLTSAPDFPDNISKFLKYFNEMFSLKTDDDVNMAGRFLSGCLLNISSSATPQFYPCQTSLIQCFLSIDCLKVEVVSSLLENLKFYVTAHNEVAQEFIVSLVLNQFKFSDQLLDTETYKIMYDEMFEILKLTKSIPCRECIIISFRELEDSIQDKAVKRLMTFYNDEELLTSKIIDTLTDMCISNETVNVLNTKILNLFRTGAPITLYPSMVNYLLNYTDSSTSLIKILREYLNWDLDANNSKDAEVKAQVFNMIKKSLFKKNMMDDWLKIIGSLNTAAEQRPIDLLVLLVILNLTEEKFQQIKKIIIQKLCNGFYDKKYLESVFLNFPSVINQNFPVFIDLLEVLHKNKLYEVYAFTAQCYKLLFEIPSCDKKKLVGSLVHFICERSSSSNLPFATNCDFKINSLTILNDIKDNEVAASILLLNYQQLLLALDFSKVQLTPNEFRSMMSLLCSLAYASTFEHNKNQSLEYTTVNERMAMLREHLEMMIKKATGSFDKKYKKYGIIGIVKLVSSMVNNVMTSSENIKDSDLSTEDLPSGQIRNAAVLIEYMFSSVRNDPYGLAMCYDELSIEYNLKKDESQMNDLFLTWLSEHLLNIFQSTYFVEYCTDEIPGSQSIKLAYKFLIEDPEIQCEMGMNMGMKVFMEQNEVDYVILPALFKIVRILMAERNGLDKLTACGSCPIMLPTSFLTDDDVLNDFDEVRAKQQLDVYFHVANWFREIIGTFVGSKDPLVQQSVRIRLSQLVKVENKIAKLLSQMPQHYQPPISDFMDSLSSSVNFEAIVKSKKGSKPKPAKRSKKAHKNTSNSDAHDEQANINQRINAHINDGSDISQFCRSIDTEVIVMLKDFNLDANEDKEDELGLPGLRFLLTVIQKEVEVSFKPKVSSFGDQKRKIQDSIEFLFMNLAKIFGMLSDELNEISQEAEKTDDEDIYYTDRTNLVKQCFYLILQIFTTVFSWPKFNNENYKEILEDSLRQLLPPTINTDGLKQSELCYRVLEVFLEYEKNVKNIQCAVALHTFMQIILKHSGDDLQRESIHDLCERFLKVDWKDSRGMPEKGGTFNGYLDQLIKGFVLDVSLKQINEYTTTFVESFHLMNNKNDILHFPSFNKSNCLLILRAYFIRLSALLFKASSMSSNLTLDYLEQVVDSFTKLQSVVKKLSMVNGYSTLLRHFQIFIKIFSSKGIPQIEKNMQRDAMKVANLVKKVQDVTRFIHMICCDSKISKNKVLLSQVPRSRQYVFEFFRNVQALCASANIPFWSSFLRKMNIDGDEIMSQSTINTSMNSVVSEDEDEPMEEDEELHEIEEDVEMIPVSRGSFSKTRSSKSTRSGSTIV
ncbi:unnamed protein product [Diamesa serratosioi]